MYVDGCHIEVSPHKEDATDYHNYKGWYSTVLLALVNHRLHLIDFVHWTFLNSNFTFQNYRYEFMYINIGAPGRCHDSKIFENSSLKKYHTEAEVLKNYTRCINNVNVPVLIIGDSAFRLSDILIKPFPYCTDLTNRQRTFNRILSRCRRVVENAFGHLKARFRRLGKGLENDIKNVNIIIKACCILHNFLIKENDGVVQTWIEEERITRVREQPIQSTRVGNNHSMGTIIRNAISQYLGNNTHMISYFLKKCFLLLLHFLQFFH